MGPGIGSHLLLCRLQRETPGLDPYQAREVGPIRLGNGHTRDKLDLEETVCRVLVWTLVGSVVSFIEGWEASVSGRLPNSLIGFFDMDSGAIRVYWAASWELFCLQKVGIGYRWFSPVFKRSVHDVTTTYFTSFLFDLLFLLIIVLSFPQQTHTLFSFSLLLFFYLHARSLFEGPRLGLCLCRLCYDVMYV